MTARHAQVLRSSASDDTAAARIRMYRSFDPAVAATGALATQAESRLDVRDPWYGDETDFEVTLAQVEAAADAVVDHVRAELTARAGMVGVRTGRAARRPPAAPAAHRGS